MDSHNCTQCSAIRSETDCLTVLASVQGNTSVCFWWIICISLWVKCVIYMPHATPNGIATRFSHFPLKCERCLPVQKLLWSCCWLPWLFWVVARPFATSIVWRFSKWNRISMRKMSDGTWFYPRELSEWWKMSWAVEKIRRVGDVNQKGKSFRRLWLLIQHTVFFPFE